MFSGTVTRVDPLRGTAGVAVNGSRHELTVRSSDIDGGGRQGLRLRDRVRLTVRNGPLGALAARVWTP